MNFAIGRTDRNHVGTRVMKASVKVGDWVSFSSFRSKISLKAPSWTNLVKTVLTKYNE